jgi:chromosome partitioning protein
MSTPVIALFNLKSGVGQTSLVYHLAWMFGELGARVVAADLDPQASLSAAFLNEERLEELWCEEDDQHTLFGSVRPLIEAGGDIAAPHLEPITDQIAVIVGDLLLSGFEDSLSDVWPRALDRDPRAFRILSAFRRIVQRAAETHRADLVLMDLGPNLGAINRAALIGADHIVFPLSPDLCSLQGLRNLGPTLRGWREGWVKRLEANPVPALSLPAGRMHPMGYVVLQHSVRLDRPVYAYDRWIDRIPSVYRQAVLNQQDGEPVSLTDDPHCLALIKHYRSLMPMAQEARKPIFLLKPADGAIGAHFQAVRAAYQDFLRLAERIRSDAGISF